MTARGVLFAITAEDLAALEALDDADAVVEYIVEVIEERWEAGFVFECVGRRKSAGHFG